MSVMVPEKTDLQPQTGEPEQQEDLSKKAHIISPAMNAKLWNQWGLSDPGGKEGVKMLVDMARQAGFEIVAVCGYIWVPTEPVGNHDVCDECMQIIQRWIQEDEG